MSNQTKKRFLLIAIAIVVCIVTEVLQWFYPEQIF